MYHRKKEADFSSTKANQNLKMNEKIETVTTLLIVADVGTVIGSFILCSQLLLLVCL